MIQVLGSLLNLVGYATIFNLALEAQYTLPQALLITSATALALTLGSALEKIK